MRVAIVGSREYRDARKVRDYVNTLSPHDVVVSGGAKGPDRWAENAARRRQLQVVIIYPDWAKHGRSAGFIRNKEIVDQADCVVAFWDGASKGTANTIEHAHKQGKHVKIIGTDA